jgi:O-antigen/teichoic acid export membrane protein
MTQAIVQTLTKLDSRLAGFGSTRVNLLATLVVILGQKGFSWVLLVILAKLGTQQDVGVFGLSVVLSAPIIVLTNLDLATLIIADTGKLKAADYIVTRLATSVVAFSGIFSAVLFLDRYREFALAIMLLSLVRIVDSWSEIVFAHFQQAQQMSVGAVLQIAKVITSLTVAAIVFGSTASLSLCALGIVCVNLAFLCLGELPALAAISNSKFVWDLLVTSSRKREIIGILSAAAPLGVAGLLGSLNANIPRYFVEHRLGLEALGVFFAIASLAAVGDCFYWAVRRALTPKIAGLYRDGKMWEYRKLTFVQSLSGAATGGVFVALAYFGGSEILHHLLGPEYSMHKPLLVVMCTVMTLAFVAGVEPALVVAKRQHIIVVGWVAAVAVVLGVAFFAIPKYGMLGAAYAVGAGSISRICVFSAALLFTPKSIGLT